MGVDLNWLLIAVAALFVICTINGYIKGFLRIIVSFIGMIAIVVAVSYISPTVSKYCMGNEKIFASVQEKVNSAFSKEIDDKIENTKEEQNETIQSLSLPELMIDAIISNNTEDVYSNLMVSVFKEYISMYITKMIINAGSFVALFVAFFILWKVILIATDLIARIPVVRGLNKFLGAVIGFAEALIIVWIFFFGIIMFLGNDLGDGLMMYVRRSDILSFLFNSNYFMKFIS